MSKASEWASRAPAPFARGGIYAVVTQEGALQANMPSVTPGKTSVAANDAIAFAAWILQTFSEPKATAP